MTYKEKLKEVLTPEFYDILLEANKRSGSKVSRINETTIYWDSFADYLVNWSSTLEGVDFWHTVHRLCSGDLNGWSYSGVNYVNGVQIFK